MVRKESVPIPKKETVLEKAGKFVLKILGIGILLGIGYTALKTVIPGLDKYINKVKKFVRS